MAFKAARAKKSKLKDARSAIPCLVILLLGMTLLFLLFYAVMSK